MSTMPATFELDKKHGGGGPTLPPRRGGGGGESRSSSDGTPDFRDRLQRYRLGVCVGLIGVSMVFIGLTSAYVVRQGASTIDPNTGFYSNDWRPMTLPVAALGLNTALLLLSSIALELSRRSLKRQYAVAEAVGEGQAPAPPWLAVSVVLGIGFLVGQVFVWNQLRAHGVYISTNPSSSFFYILTVLHAIHLAGGMAALLYAEGTELLHRSVAKRLLVVDVTSIYWHFMAVLWVYIFVLLQFVK
ncbi:MAG: cytochrome c oxidase subunit 3 [Candidatus Koribacter versatilis]|uniref:Cytochrome c oxidase subunit 3 n=1 Tax=Candidatus Korobacter versatilis TaxID=658062 RepID=A0A932A6X0_9BACT|nr:cytochrome c oxidase subunit 3 [Candidatus Koribacter versatilis]